MLLIWVVGSRKGKEKDRLGRKGGRSRNFEFTSIRGQKKVKEGCVKRKSEGTLVV